MVFIFLHKFMNSKKYVDRYQFNFLNEFIMINLKHSYGNLKKICDDF